MMLRFFASIVGCVAMLSGGLMGWVRYAQIDPDYSCLSFDNITVQLDTSLFMRETVTDRYVVSPDGVVIVSFETEVGHTNRLYPLPHPTEINNQSLIMTDKLNGKRAILQENISGRMSSRWSPNGKYFAYFWESALTRKFSFSIADRNGSNILEIPLEGGLLGWSPNGEYLLVTVPEHIVTIDMQNTSYKDSEIPTIPQQGFPYSRKLVGSTHLLVEQENIIYLFDFHTQIWKDYTFPAGTQIGSYSFSPNGQYLAVTLLQDYIKFTTYRKTVTHILDIGQQEPTEYGVTPVWQSSEYGHMQPQWSADSESLYIMEELGRAENHSASAGRLQLLRFDLSTFETSKLAFPIYDFFFAGEFMVIRGYAAKYMELLDTYGQVLYRLDGEFIHLRRFAEEFAEEDYFAPVDDENVYLFTVVDEKASIRHLSLDTLQETELYAVPPQTPINMWLENNIGLILNGTEDNLNVVTTDVTRHTANLTAIDWDGYYPYSFANIQVAYLKDKKQWIAVVPSIDFSNLDIYQISIEGVTKLATLASSSRQGGQEIRIQSMVSPDEKYMAVIVNIYPSFTIYGVLLEEGKAVQIGTFPTLTLDRYGNEFFWTQCTY